MFEKKIYLVVLSIILALILIMNITNGTHGNPITNITKGVNNFDFANQSIFYASQLFALNPDIEVIIYYDLMENKNISYVNAFGGVGKNFLINPGTNYEIYVSKDIVLEVP